MGGDIGVISDEGRGSNFWFTLTLPQVRLLEIETATTAQGARRTGRLLLVEDVDVNQLLARALLEADGHHVDVVASGEAAVAAVEGGGRYDLVLMDVQMPGIGGMAATEAIRQLPGGSELPIVAMTANVLPEQVRAFKEAGMDDHVGKPINRGELQATIERWLGMAQVSAREADVVLDEKVFATIADLLGPAKMLSTLRKLVVELESRLVVPPVSVEKRRDFARDAHIVTSVAGMIGFADLARHCTRLLTLPTDDADGYAAIGEAVMTAKGAALHRLCAIVEERETPSPMPVHSALPDSVPPDQARQRRAASTR